VAVRNCAALGVGAVAEVPRALPRSRRLEGGLAERAVELGALHGEIGARRATAGGGKREALQEVADGRLRLAAGAEDAGGLAAGVLQLVDERGGDAVVADVVAARPVAGAGEQRKRLLEVVALPRLTHLRALR